MSTLIVPCVGRKIMNGIPQYLNRHPSNKEKLEVLQNRGASFIGYTVENEEFKISALNILQEAGLSFIKIIYGCPYSERKELIASDEELERKVIEL